MDADSSFIEVSYLTSIHFSGINLKKTDFFIATTLEMGRETVGKDTDDANKKKDKEVYYSKQY